MIVGPLWLLPRAQSLSGRVTDAVTHRPVAGASVYFPQLRVGTFSDTSGSYNFSNLPRGTFVVEVQALGYATQNRSVNIGKSGTLDFEAAVSYSTLQPVVITSLGNPTNIQRSPIPVSIVSHDNILQGSYNTVIAEVATQPGVSETTEGVGTTKPQINGLGFDRVLVLTDGLPQEDFQWGDDHGILIDPYAVYDAEVIRGPASLQYGASAEAGVINFKTAPFAPSGTVQGSWLSEYHTNNGYIGDALHVGGNQHGFLYDFRASGELAHSYRNPKDGYVWGSAWNQGNTRLTLGLDKPWGYSRLSLSALGRRIQVPDGNRDSTGRFLFDFPQGKKVYPTLANFLSYDATIASDKILDEYQAWWQNSFRAGKGNIDLDLGFTESVHHDIDTGTVGENNMAVYDIPYSLKYRLSDAEKGFKLTTGINGMYEAEHNLPAPPLPYEPDYEIPDYSNFEIGGYAVAEKTIRALTLSGGLRYDVTDFKGRDLYGFTPFNNTYAGWSGSIGAAYQLPRNQYVKANISKSFRAPAINELTSNGLNIGSNAFQLGNINLKPEQGYQVDLAYGYAGENVSLEVDAFYNHISHFIFADRTDSMSSGYPVYEYVSSNTAILTGVSAFINVRLLKQLEWDNRFTYIYTFLPNATDSTDHLPWIPAPHLHTDLILHLGIFRNAYIKAGLAKYWEQNNVYSALHTELPSAGYWLFHAGIGTDFVQHASGRVICSFYLNCTNLTNVAYADHLNLAQYFYSLNGNVVTVTRQRQGVFDMGRDISLKVVFPFGGKHPD